MPYEIKTNGFHNDVVEWLQENVGNLLWSRPIVEWRGRGWTMNHVGSLTNTINDGTCRYLIRVDDERLAILTMLRWS